MPPGVEAASGTAPAPRRSSTSRWHSTSALKIAAEGSVGERQCVDRADSTPGARSWPLRAHRPPDRHQARSPRRVRMIRRRVSRGVRPCRNRRRAPRSASGGSSRDRRHSIQQVGVSRGEPPHPLFEPVELGRIQRDPFTGEVCRHIAAWRSRGDSANRRRPDSPKDNDGAWRAIPSPVRRKPAGWFGTAPRHRPPGHPLVGDDVAPIEHHREQRAHPLDPVDRPTRQRAVAIVLGKGDEEIGPVAADARSRKLSGK